LDEQLVNMRSIHMLTNGSLYDFAAYLQSHFGLGRFAMSSMFHAICRFDNRCGNQTDPLHR